MQICDNCIRKDVGVAFHLKMAGMDATAPKEDQLAVIKFLTLKGCKPVDIHRRLLAVYSGTSVLKPTVTRWARMFSDGRHKTRNLPWPGQSHKVMAEKQIMNNDTAVKGNRRRNIRDVANKFNVSIGTVYNTITNILKYRLLPMVPRANAV
ncbi:uncharacterized protein TNCV_3628911 [Trichonephila clavipes]|nr:uncharacterized protein TNCV_3628911 [Trichonephila clavipes]